jgi:hypothetical protein
VSNPQEQSRNHRVVLGLNERKEEWSPLWSGREHIVCTLLELVERNKIRATSVVTPEEIDTSLRPLRFLNDNVIKHPTGCANGNIVRLGDRSQITQAAEDARSTKLSPRFGSVENRSN